jgi:hypothetical protein
LYFAAASNSQRGYIEFVARTRGLRNLAVITADINMRAAGGTFARRLRHSGGELKKRATFEVAH